MTASALALLWLFVHGGLVDDAGPLRVKAKIANAEMNSYVVTNYEFGCTQSFIAFCKKCSATTPARPYILLLYKPESEEEIITSAQVDKDRFVRMIVLRDAKCDTPIGAFGRTTYCGDDFSVTGPPFVIVGSKAQSFDEMGKYGVYPCYRLMGNPYQSP